MYGPKILAQTLSSATLGERERGQVQVGHPHAHTRQLVLKKHEAVYVRSLVEFLFQGFE